MSETQLDVLVVGGGPGGYTAAIRSAQLGLKTGIVERDKLGGVCLNWGCIPTKALLRNAEIVRMVRNPGEWGIHVDNLRIDFPAIIQRSRRVADRLSKGVEFLMKKNRIEYLRGTATLQEPGVVSLRTGGTPDHTLRARHVIIATGARPRSLPGVAFDRVRVITSTEAMSLPQLPASMIIVGAGAIGIEFAYFYGALGTSVTVVEMLPSILPVEDRELTKMLEASLSNQGIAILTGTRVDSVTTSADHVSVRVTREGKSREVTGDVALVAIGVQGNVESLGLEALGVTVVRGSIVVDRDYRTNVAGVYAVGDVIGPPWLAHVASAEGIHCVEAIAGKNPEPLDYTSIPGCTYCQPQIASVGLTEEKAKADGHDVTVGRFPFRAAGKAMAIGETEGLVKLVFDARYGELLGAHIMGADATEMIAELVVAKRLGTTGRDLVHAVHAHPTLGEAVMEAAAAAYGEAINI
jgi:dihydrolipoamide dehydrogenase